jgi:hypothetical protein
LRGLAGGLPHRRVTDHRSAERVVEPSQIVADRNPAATFIKNASAGIVDDDAGHGDGVYLRIGPKAIILHRVTAQQMAVEAAEMDQRRSSRLRHPQPVAARRPGMAHQHAVGTRADMLAEQLVVRGEAAIGDDDRVGEDREIAITGPRVDADHAAAFEPQRRGPGAEQHAALALLQALTELVDHAIGPASAPVLAGKRSAWRRQRKAVPVDRAALGKGRTLARQPIDRAAGIVGDRSSEVRVGLTAGLPVDGGQQLVATELHVVVGDMKDAAGPARTAQIVVVGAGFDDRGAQAQLGAAQRRAQPGKSAADRDEVEMQRFSHASMVTAGKARA